MSKTKEEMINEIVQAMLDGMSSVDAEQYIRACETEARNKLTLQEVTNEWYETFTGD